MKFVGAAILVLSATLAGTPGPRVAFPIEVGEVVFSVKHRETVSVSVTHGARETNSIEVNVGRDGLKKLAKLFSEAAEK